jgi:hypothetical protein
VLPDLFLHVEGGRHDAADIRQPERMACTISFHFLRRLGDLAHASFHPELVAT